LPVAVFVVYGQQVPCFLIEFPSALGAYESVDLQGAFPVVSRGRGILLQFLDDFFHCLTFTGFFRPS